MRRNIIGVIVIILILGFGGYFGYRRFAQANNLLGGANGQRQAVFLTNGQVYFGYISQQADQVVILRDIYYFKAESKDTNSADTSSVDKNQFSLVKLGGEMHGPEDVMYINRDQIIFYEDLRPDSKVNDVIRSMGGK